MKSIRFFPVLIRVISALCILSAANAYTSNSLVIQPEILKKSTHYTTWQGIEPDKWASLWLIKRYISNDAYFVLIPPRSTPDKEAIPFGIPGASIRRANKQAMFHRLKTSMGLNQRSLDQMDTIIHDIEVNIWEAPTHPYTHWIEVLYRQLQARYHRDQVPVDCYLTFFDTVAELVVQPNLKAEIFEQKLSLKKQCPGLRTKNNAADEQVIIRQIDHLELLRAISLGKNVIFIDTREEEEYSEVHLPGAKLLRLREVDEHSVKAYQQADLVVPYCVKDFRGFEVARAMQEQGIKNVATLSPNGLKGWLKAKLPVTKNAQQDESPALEKLMLCAMEPESCLGEIP